MLKCPTLNSAAQLIIRESAMTPSFQGLTMKKMIALCIALCVAASFGTAYAKAPNSSQAKHGSHSARSAHSHHVKSAGMHKKSGHKKSHKKHHQA